MKSLSGSLFFSWSILSILLSKFFIFELDLAELLHVLVEVWASLQSDEELCFLAIASRSSNGDGSRSDFLESCVVVSDQVLRCNHTCRHSVSESVKLDGFMDLEVSFAEENVEVWILFN